MRHVKSQILGGETVCPLPKLTVEVSLLPMSPEVPYLSLFLILYYYFGQILEKFAHQGKPVNLLSLFSSTFLSKVSLGFLSFLFRIILSYFII